MEVCDRVLIREGEVTIRWVPSHSGIPGNEKADQFVKAATGRTASCSDGDIPEELRRKATLSQMTRSATEARSRASVERIASHLGARRYRPPPGRGLRCQHLRSTRKKLAGRYY